MVLTEFGGHLGGMTSGGLGKDGYRQQRGAIGGVAREFYKRVGRRYGTNEGWMFEPHVAEEVFDDMIRGG